MTPDEPRIPREAWAALACGIAMAGGYALHHSPVGTALYVASIAAGASVALADAGASLRRGRVDVHGLMLAAAFGALAIGKAGEGASLLFLFCLSGALEAFAMGRTRDAIRKLVKLRPTTLRLADGTIGPVERAGIGDHFLVFPGEAIPLDGVIVDGETSVDQATMTGEAEPVARVPGDPVLSGTLNLEGRIQVRATAAQKDSTLERVIGLVAAAQEEKSLAGSERLADRVGRWYAPLVLLTALGWFVLRAGSHPLTDAAYPPLTLLVAASPCALVLSSPAAILAALAGAGRRGLLVRSGSVLEHLAAIDTVAFDKTGTLTTGKPTVRDAWASDGDAEGLRARVAAVESPLPHPLARAIVRAAGDLPLPPASDFHAVAGRGVTARVDGVEHRVGRPEWILETVSGPDADALRDRIEGARAEGASVVAAAWDGGVGLFALTDTIRDDAVGALAALKALGVQTLLLTGDHARAGAALARQLPIGAVRADLHPEDKARLVGEIQDAGKRVAMVGDGVNDAPALTRALVGVTLGGIGSDVALESADMVVMEDRLDGVPDAIRLARRTRSVVFQNVVVSLLGVGLLSLAVLARGVPLPLAVVFHEGTTVLVVLNGLRLLRV